MDIPCGPAWQRAIDYGIDVSLLVENLRMTPDERLKQLVAMQRLFDLVTAEREAREALLARPSLAGLAEEVSPA
jgi:hypothetical protein